MKFFIIDTVLESKFKGQNRASKEDGQVVSEGFVKSMDAWEDLSKKERS